MSFLSWAFAFGAAAVILPILFHLIRPTPKGSQRFSSLMFLGQSPPRIKKRNRVDHWLLLLLRAAVVLLIVAAFMRPFFRTGGEIFVSDLPGNRVAILIDKSSSMRRPGLWQDAQEKLNETLGQLEAGDDVALFAFDNQLETLVNFSEAEIVDLNSRKKLVRDQFSALQPSWLNTDLGNALAATADFVSELEEDRRSETGLQIVLISDMQQGADLGGLQTYAWPDDVRLSLQRVQGDSAGNAVVRLLPDEVAAALDAGNRVRVANAADSPTESFEVSWQDSKGTIDQSSTTSFYVPPGTSQLLRVPDPQMENVNSLVVTGDSCEFDNQYFVAPRSPRKISIAFFGDDQKDDADGYLYFLERVVPRSKTQVVQVDAYSLIDPQPWKDGVAPQLIVLAGKPSPAVVEKLKAWVEQGGLLFCVVAEPVAFESVSLLVPGVRMGSLEIEEDDYAMLGTIDFSHPLFLPLSGPRFNDFTSIRFWKRTDVRLADSSEDVQVIARFDDDSVALWQNRIGRGTVIGFSSSWRPQDSQLAMSTKFVPLITNLLGMSDEADEAFENRFVGDRIRIPDGKNGWVIKVPDGSSLQGDGASDRPQYFEMPGIYTLEKSNEKRLIAVNMNPDESQTAPMDPDRLESFEVKMGEQPTRAELVGSLQKLKDRQLEQRQNIWKWLLLAVMGLLIIETWFAGKRSQSRFLTEAPA